MREAGRRVGFAGRRRSLLAVGVVVVLVGLTVLLWPGKPKVFPGEIPGERTDVSAGQAFHYYGISTPASTKGLRYSALSSDDTYPVVALFSIG